MIQIHARDSILFSKVQRRLYVVWMRRPETFSCPLRLVRYLSTPSSFGQSPTKKSANLRESLLQLSEGRALCYALDADMHDNYVKHPEF